MVDDWRSKWHQYTDGETSVDFPFVFAQLNSMGNASGQYLHPKAASSEYGEFGEWAPGFPSIRLAQSNARRSLSNTFMAVILYTPVASGAVHSPYKQCVLALCPLSDVSVPTRHYAMLMLFYCIIRPVGQRLARGILSIVYQMYELAKVDPVALSARVHVREHRSSNGTRFRSANVVVTLGGLGDDNRMLQPPSQGALGFEVLGGEDRVWHSTPVQNSEGPYITLGLVPPRPVACRYLYYSSPCGLQVRRYGNILQPSF